MIWKALLLGCVYSWPTPSVAEDWRIALPGWHYEFPRDHHSHDDFKTEWWYFTGNLDGDDGNRFGYELTFFREGVRAPGARSGTTSRFIVDDLKFAHFALTDVGGKHFLVDQQVSRGAFGEAGFDAADRLAWIGAWSVTLDAKGRFSLKATNSQAALRLELNGPMAPVIHGIDGVSQKSAGVGNASHYYSQTRLTTSGEITVNGRTRKVRGASWFDHEWATNQLGANQAGWDWLSVQLTDGRELMLYRMRLTDGNVDPASSGSFVDGNGGKMHLTSRDFEMTPTRFWKSAKTQALYPIEWLVELPTLGARFRVRPVLDNQELDLKPLSYWEGAVDVTGDEKGAAISGRGYLELTGYAAPLRELTR